MKRERERERGQKTDKPTILTRSDSVVTNYSHHQGFPVRR